MGALADTLNPVLAAPPPTKATCHTRLALESLDDEDRAALQAALADRRVTNAAIARAVADAGIHCGEQSIARHRKGVCQCSKAVG